MNSHEENRRKVYDLIQNLHGEMKLCEREEEFERCADLRDIIDSLGMFLTCYSDYNDILPIIYSMMKAEGDIIVLSTEFGNFHATFDYFGETWSFMVTRSEYKELQELEAQQNETRK